MMTQNTPRLFFEHLDEIKKQFSQKEAVIFLDYDGTLTPIVDTPDLAVMDDAMREVVKELAARYKVAIISGRATDDVRSKVQIDDIFYAGSHGFEIVDPKGGVTINKEAQEIQPVIDKVYSILKEKVKDVDGALVEHVKYTISMHYRLVSDDDFSRVEQAVNEILKEHPKLKVTHGKKVFEIRPQMDWHKGKAVEWILNVHQFSPEKNWAVYIGDDTTDEDAFAVLENKGLGILVADPLRESKARYGVKDVDEVKEVLEFLINQ